MEEWDSVLQHIPHLLGDTGCIWGASGTKPRLPGPKTDSGTRPCMGVLRDSMRAPGLQRLSAGRGAVGHLLQQGCSLKRAPLLQLTWTWSVLTPHPYGFCRETLSAPCSRNMQNLLLLSSSMCASVLHPRQWNLQPTYCPVLMSHQYLSQQSWPARCHPTRRLPQTWRWTCWCSPSSQIKP